MRDTRTILLSDHFFVFSFIIKYAATIAPSPIPRVHVMVIAFAPPDNVSPHSQDWFFGFLNKGRRDASQKKFVYFPFPM